MGFSSIAAQQREKAAESLKSFLAFGLMGSIALHIGVLGFGIGNLLDRVPESELEDEPMELTLVEPPTSETEKPVEEDLKKSSDSSSSDETPRVVSAPSSIAKPCVRACAIAPSSPSVVAQSPTQALTNVPKKEVVENLKTPIPQQKSRQFPTPEIPTQPKPVITPSPIQSPSPALTSGSSVAVNQSPQYAKPKEKLTDQLRGIRNFRESQGIATNNTALSDKLSAVSNRSNAPGGIGNRTGRGTGTGSGSITGGGFGTVIGSGRGTGTGSGSGSTVATGSGAIKRGGNRNSDSTGSESGRLACRNCSKPKYPESARRRGVEGTAKIKVDVDDKGNVTNVRVAESSGNSDLDEAAIRAARRWKFDTPRGSRQGISAKVDFAIEGSERSRQIGSGQRQRQATRRKRSSETQNATRTRATERTTASSTPTRRARTTATTQPATTSLPRRTTASTPRRQRVQPQSLRGSQPSASISRTRLRQSLRRSRQQSQQLTSPPQRPNSAPSSGK